MEDRKSILDTHLLLIFAISLLINCTNASIVPSVDSLIQLVVWSSGQSLPAPNFIFTLLSNSTALVSPLLTIDCEHTRRSRRLASINRINQYNVGNDI